MRRHAIHKSVSTGYGLHPALPSRNANEMPLGKLTRSADRMAYHTAPAMLTARPAAFQGSKMKSPKAKAPTIVMIAFFRLPAAGMRPG